MHSQLHPKKPIEPSALPKEKQAKFDKMAKEDFIKDEVDELYGFPKDITETTVIFLSLGRRDVKLEYKHKTLSL
jgi:hypothetical protein